MIALQDFNEPELLQTRKEQKETVETGMYEIKVHVSNTGWRRIIGCVIFICHSPESPQKSPIVSGSVA